MVNKDKYINKNISKDSEDYFDFPQFTIDFAEERFNQQKYINEFKKKTYKQYNLLINKDKYEDVIKKLDSVASKNSYIIDLIRKDLESDK